MSKVRSDASSFSHLSLTDRCSIEAALNDGCSLAEAARKIGRNRSTVSREIKAHIQYLPASTRSFANGSGRKTYDCAFLDECGTSKKSCDTFPCHKCIPCSCLRRDRKGFCNGCENISRSNGCKLAKKMYIAKDADLEYQRTLKQTRAGVNLTEEEVLIIQEIVANGVHNGQSLYHIARNNSEKIPVSVRTLYNYVNGRLFAPASVLNIDLPEKTRRHPRKKKKVVTKKRKDRKVYIGRTYQDYLQFMKNHPEASVVEMDTVYNRMEGPFIQTFLFKKPHGLFYARYSEEKTAKAMTKGLQEIRNLIDEEDFKKHFQVILTDRGSEFVDAEGIEALGCRLFFCDPMAAHQKGQIENKHLLLRRIFPKDKDLKDLGLNSQEKLDLAVSHLNSYSLESLDGKSSYDYFSFLYSKSNMLEKLNIKKVSQDDVRLKPDLLLKRL